MTKKLYKSQKNKIISGVCGGIAEYFKFDATIVRIIFIAAIAIPKLWGFGLVAYIVCAIIMPKQEFSDYQDDDIENMKSANMDDDEVFEEKKSKSKKSEKKNAESEGGRSDKDFNEYFKK